MDPRRPHPHRRLPRPHPRRVRRHRPHARGLCRFNESVGGQNTPTSGYHETVTVLWIKLLAAFHRDTAPTSRAAFAARAVEHFAPQRDLLSRFYDFDLVASTEARQRWIPPTLQPLD